jgi:hypothetical protein
MDLYKEVYEANTLMKFTVIVVDSGSPVRGATAAVEIDIDNSCLIDVEYKAIPYTITVNISTGEIHHRLPGYYYFEYSEYIEYQHRGNSPLTPRILLLLIQ